MDIFSTGDNNINDLQSESNDIVKLLTKKRNDLISQLSTYNKEAEQLRNEYTIKLAALKGKQLPVQNALQHVEALLKIEGHDISKNEINSVSRKSDRTNITFIDMAFEILKRANEPLHFKVIYENIEKNGIHVPGKDGAATLLAKMSRDSRFKRTKKRGTYALSIWRIAKAKARNRKSKKSKGTKSK
jgi:hypothetical protein